MKSILIYYSILKQLKIGKSLDGYKLPTIYDLIHIGEEHDMEKALVSFIGNHDPYADEKKRLGPILSILKSRKFDALFLLFNSDKYWDKVFETQAFCNKHFPMMKVEMRLAESINPIDYNLVYPSMYKVISRIVKDNPKTKFTISITSGTPTMHSCWILLVQGKVINAEIIQVSREMGIEEVKLTLDDFPKTKETPEIKVELTRLSRENEQLKKSLDYSLKNGFYIPESGFDIDKEIIPAYYIGALNQTNGNASKAAKLLGLEAHTFRKRLKALGIEIKNFERK